MLLTKQQQLRTVYSCLESRLLWWHREGRRPVTSCSRLCGRWPQVLSGSRYTDLGRSICSSLRVFYPPLLLCFGKHSLGSHTDWVVLIELAIIYICHLTPFCLWFQETQDASWPCVLSLYPLWFFLPVLHARFSHWGVEAKVGAEPVDCVCVSVFMWVLAVFLHNCLSWNLSRLSWTLTSGVKIKPDILCLLWSADIITTGLLSLTCTLIMSKGLAIVSHTDFRMGVYMNHSHIL